MTQNHYEQHMAFTKPQQRYMDTLIAQHGFRGALIEAVRTASDDGLIGAARQCAALRGAVQRAVEALGPDAGPQALSEAQSTQEAFGVLVWLFEMVAQKQELPNPKRIAQAEAMTQVVLAVSTLLFEKHGQQSYVVSEGLSERLRRTELRGLHGRDLRLPYPTIYIEVPASAGLRVWHHVDGWCPLLGAYLSEHKNRWWLFFVGASKTNPSPVEHYYFSSSVPLEDDKTLEECLVDTYARLGRVQPEHFDEIRAGWRAVFEWLLNVVIYTTWPDAERESVIANAEARRLLERLERAPKGHPRRRKLLDELKATPPERRHVLGRHVVRFDRAAGVGAGGHDMSGSAMTTRVLVQGHWRHLEPGPGKPWKERKLLWIEPAWRGPVDAAPAEATTHTLSEPAC